MNEPQSTPAKKSSQRTVLVAVAVILLIGAIGFFASRMGLDKALVRQAVDRFATQLAERGKLEGRDIRFTYDDIEVTTGLTDKHAILRNPQLVVRPLVPPTDADKPHSLLITTPRLEIYPESNDLSAMKISLPEEVNVATEEAPEASLMKIMGSTPLELRVAQSSSEGRNYSSLRYESPEEIILTYLREHTAEGAEEATPEVVPVYEKLRITMDKGVADLTIERDGGNLGEGTLDMQNIKIIPEVQPEGAISIAAITSEWSNGLNEQNLNVVNSTFRIDEVTAPAELLPYAPLSMALDFTYEGAMPNTPEEIASIRAQDSSFKLRTFVLKTKDAEVTATADFVATPEDILPVGMANLSMTNLPFIIAELKKNELLTPENERLAEAILQQVTGVPYAELKDVQVDIKRVRGGAFMIGKSTFEELFALLLSGALGGPVPSGVPVPEVEEAPLPAPVEDTRG